MINLRLRTGMVIKGFISDNFNSLAKFQNSLSILIKSNETKRELHVFFSFFKRTKENKVLSIPRFQELKLG